MICVHISTLFAAAVIFTLNGWFIGREMYRPLT